MAVERVVYCHYERAWIPMGRARTRCPRCGAVVDNSHVAPYSSSGGTHPVKTARKGEGKR